MKWKTRLPDASLIITKILPGFMPRKRLDDEKKIPILIRETHVAAAILGFGCVFLWNGVGGWIMSILFLLINIPFIIMQRFNRPRLIAADMMLKRRNGNAPESVCGNEAPTEENFERSCTAESAEA